MYIVTKPFYDLQDVTKADHTKDGDIPREFWLYKVGDVYPRDGAIPPSEQRIAELASAYNKQGTPLIEWVEPEPEPEPTPEPAPEPAQPAETDEKPAKEETPVEPKKPARKPPEKAPAKKRAPAKSAGNARKKGT
jgi:hypothetical protein